MSDSIKHSIQSDIREEFASIRKDVARHTDSGVTVDHARELLSEHVPSLVLNRSQLLLHTLLGYMMDEATTRLANVPPEAKKSFYDLELRTKIKNSFLLKPDALEFSIDRRLVYGAVGAGGVLLVGGSATVFSVPTIIPPIFLGMGTIVAGGVAFKLLYSSKCAEKFSMQAIKDDVEQYLEDSEKQVREWLTKTQKAFSSELDRFINTLQEA